MALTTTEEAQVRQLIDQNAALLSLASNEPTIISKLAAAKISLADLTAASALNDADLFLLRQGTQEKSLTGTLLKSYAATVVPDATETVKGIVELATSAETQAGTSTSLAVNPAGLASALAGAGSSVSAAFSKLAASATGPNASVLVTADELVVKNASNKYKTLSAVNVTINTASTGANGLDTGTIATSTWYALYVIWNGTTTSGLISLSATAPTMPSGYTHRARVGWIMTDGTANKYPLSFIQKGNMFQYVVSAGSNVTKAPQMASGNQGSGIASSPTWAAVSISNFAPSTAKSIILTAGATNISAGTGFLIASNSSMGGNISTNPSICGFDMGGGTMAVSTSQQLKILLESSNIFAWAFVSTFFLSCYGWEDNL